MHLAHDQARHHLLNLYQTTNFRVFQTERVCRRQFQIWRKWQKFIHMGRKHCGKRRKPNFSFSHGVFKRLVSQGRQKASLCGNGLTLYQTTKFWKWPNWKHLQTTNVAKLTISIFDNEENIVEKGENTGYQDFLLFPQCFPKPSSLGSSKVAIV